MVNYTLWVGVGILIDRDSGYSCFAASIEGIDFSSLIFPHPPDLIAGMISIDELGNNKLAYSFFTRHRFYLRVNQRQNGLRDVIAGSPGMESYMGEVILDWNRLKLTFAFSILF